ncbi:MAG TPA: hypothetical protein ENF17_09020 [Candidatus Aminicenantes bacterium]|nr:hypothetical protein [Candidatus Aminicenantes bacterium]
MDSKPKANFNLVAEPTGLGKERRGGAVNLLLGAIILEAGRMLKEGRSFNEVELASQKAFGQSQGLLSFCQQLGFPKIMEFLNYLAQDDFDDELLKVYDNFFSLKENVFSLPGENIASLVEKKITGDLDEKTMNLLVRRFLAVAFMVAAEVLGAGLVEMSKLEEACQQTLGWKKGPFSLMNQVGIQETMRMVIEQLEICHRKEINFPVPDLLINQAQANAPWVIKVM